MVKSRGIIVKKKYLYPLSSRFLPLVKMRDKKQLVIRHPFKAALTECVKCGTHDITTFNCENYLCHNCLKIPWISIPYHPKLKLDKQFHYMASDGLNILRVKQLLTLHYVASKMKYDSDTLSLVQEYLIKSNVKPKNTLKRVIELRESAMYHNSASEYVIEYIDESVDEYVDGSDRIPPDSWEDES